jgi:hypothetical protein
MADIGGSLVSDTSRISSFGSLSVSGRPTIYNCRWSWCRESFFTNADLVHHVVDDHVRKSVPVRRRDIAYLRRVEGVIEGRHVPGGSGMSSSSADLRLGDVNGAEMGEFVSSCCS